MGGITKMGQAGDNQRGLSIFHRALLTHVLDCSLCLLTENHYSGTPCTWCPRVVIFRHNVHGPSVENQMRLAEAVTDSSRYRHLLAMAK
jgi:hypothetical protein